MKAIAPLLVVYCVYWVPSLLMQGTSVCFDDEGNCAPRSLAWCLHLIDDPPAASTQRDSSTSPNCDCMLSGQCLWHSLHRWCIQSALCSCPCKLDPTKKEEPESGVAATQA